MTIDEFIAELEKTPRTWIVSRFGAIRNQRRCCPLVEVSGGRSSDNVYADNLAVKQLRMRRRTAESVMLAADAFGDDHCTLRARLLRACGLEEQG